MPSAGQQQPMASAGAMGSSQQATRKADRQVPAEQLNAAMQAGASAVAEALHGNRKIGGAALKMINERDKVGSAAKAATQLLSEVNKRARMPERIMVPLAILTADELMDMAEETGRARFSEQEAQQVALTTAEMVLTSYGVPQERAAELAQRASREDLQRAENAFEQALGEPNEPNERPSPQEQANV